MDTRQGRSVKGHVTDGHLPSQHPRYICSHFGKTGSMDNIVFFDAMDAGVEIVEAILRVDERLPTLTYVAVYELYDPYLADACEIGVGCFHVDHDKAVLGARRRSVQIRRNVALLAQHHHRPACSLLPPPELKRWDYSMHEPP